MRDWEFVILRASDFKSKEAEYGIYMKIPFPLPPKKKAGGKEVNLACHDLLMN